MHWEIWTNHQKYRNQLESVRCLPLVYKLENAILKRGKRHDDYRDGVFSRFWKRYKEPVAEHMGGFKEVWLSVYITLFQNPLENPKIGID